MGRAGRRGEGLALLIPGADALDRYFINHPDALLGRANEAAILDPANPEIRIGHLRAAAHELPLTPADDEVLGAGALEAAEALVEAGELVRTPGGLAWRGAGSPAGSVSLRSGTTDAIAVVERASGMLLGMLEPERAFATVHEGAVYLHRGETYLAETLDLADRVALVSPFNGPWYTQPRRETETSIVRALIAPSECCGVGSPTARSRSRIRWSRTSGAACPSSVASTRSRSRCPPGTSSRARSGSCRRTS